MVGGVAWKNCSRTEDKKQNLLFHRHFHNNLCESVSCDMDIDEVFTCSLDMCPVWELDVLLFECYSEFLVHLSTNSMLVETAEYLPILSLEGECNTLPVEFLLYLECLFEADTCLILASFFIGFDFFETFCSDLFCYPFWYEGITCLGC